MKSTSFIQRIIAAITLAFLVASATHAQELTPMLEQLDKAIINKNAVRERLHQRIDSIRHTIPHASQESLGSKYREICDIYSNLQADSALHYLNLMDDLNSPNSEHETHICIARATMLGVKGQYNHAITILDSLSKHPTTPELHAEYLHAYRTVYGWAATYSKKNNSLEYAKYERFTESYRDSILANSTAGVKRSIVMADKLIASNQPDEAINILLDILPQATGIQLAYAYCNLAESYRLKGDTDHQMYYLAKTALEDINRGATEYVSLPTLAMLLYQQGDITRAYQYLFCSLEDAQFGNAFLRAIEINEVFPVICRAYQEEQQSTRNMEHALLCLLFIVIVITIVAYAYTHRKKRQLAAARQMLAAHNVQLEKANLQLEEANGQLEVANSQLAKANDQLEEANDIREHYVMFYLARCREYFDNMDRYRKDLLRLAKNGMYDDLRSRLKSSDIFNDEQHRFYHDFDESFLHIHPSFITDVNALLGPEAQLMPKKRELLNTELRILALIRLGVTDTAQLAHFLNCSMPTIYNYRSRIVASSQLSKEEFMERLMAIA